MRDETYWAFICLRAYLPSAQSSFSDPSFNRSQDLSSDCAVVTSWARIGCRSLEQSYCSTIAGIEIEGLNNRLELVHRDQLEELESDGLTAIEIDGLTFAHGGRLAGKAFHVSEDSTVLSAEFQCSTTYLDLARSLKLMPNCMPSLEAKMMSAD